MTLETVIKQIGINLGLCCALVLSSMNAAPVKASESASSANSVLIYQLQTGASGSASQEYISIYNNSDQAVDVSNWCITYSSASDTTQTPLGCLTPPTNTKLLLASRTSALFASNDFLQANSGLKSDTTFTAGMSGTSGHIKLLDSNKNSVDILGWGSAIHPEGTSSSANIIGKILQRVANAQVLQDSDNNNQDFQQASLVLPTSGVYEEYSPNTLENAALSITELLPDALGADSGNEYIELYNPLDRPINLKGYNLQGGASYSKSYPLPEITIQPGEYLALDDAQTGVTLPNTSGSVRLITPSGNIVSTTDVYNQLGEEVSWSYINGSWQGTFTSTPNVSNILTTEKPCEVGQVRNPETGHCRKVESSTESGSAACQPDQERNPATGRCRKISAIAASLLPCKEEQVRNLDTGRCRAASSASAKAVCKAGQVRNPETGRCKNSSVTSNQKACTAGQERNTSTGRCRKSSSNTSGQMKQVKDVAAPLVANSAKWWVAGITALGSAGYAVYEWRREVFSLVDIILNRFTH